MLFELLPEEDDFLDNELLRGEGEVETTSVLTLESKVVSLWSLQYNNIDLNIREINDNY